MSLSTKKVLDDSGLAYFWGKIKSLVESGGGSDTVPVAYGNATTSGTARSITADNFRLVKGAVASVIFTYSVGNNATLNVGGTGAMYIYYKGLQIKSGVIGANDTGVFVYDGNNWQLVSVNTNSGLGTVYGVCTTEASASLTATTNRPITKVPGAMAVIKFTYAVTKSSPTLLVGDINLGISARIYYHGVSVPIGTIKAGDTWILVYDGSYWQLIASDVSYDNGNNIAY